MAVIAYGKTKAEKGLRLREMARGKLHGAASLAKADCRVDAHLLALEARAADQQADELLTPSEPTRKGTGGEVRLTHDEAFEHPGLAETLDDPDGVNIEASHKRLELLADAGAMSLGADAAQTFGARNSIEKMLAHQVAALHATALHFIARAQDELHPLRPRGATAEAARLANVAARLMEGSQRAALTIGRMRSGGKQTVVVQHVHVEGGNVAVAGTVDRGAGVDDGG